ncbi:hypothetical protein BGZ97_009621 [Linnemannia gamsii]|jgi:hypothetical protein|uniref:Uncharacterized protein n=1 Tax=Linnemannia gamsii TaxID=64522 RepID=A0A9P6UPM3_9FUNG|nr:hypothetical protein BGZ97_009621 [Linnemannia gamsii]
MKFTLAVMAVVAAIISIASSAPITANTNNNSGDLTLRADAQPQGIRRQTHNIPEQPQPVQKRDDRDFDSIVNNSKDRESEIAYKFPIGEPCTMKPRDGSDSYTSDNNDLSPAMWCPPQTLHPEPNYWI